MQLRIRCASILCGCAALMAVASAKADITQSTYINGNNYNYRVKYMPDFDQRRFGLGNEGNNHCVPASSLNVLAYVANHGYPFIAPGPGNWQSPTLYSTATAQINLLGFTMGTDPNNGTNMQNARQVLANRLGLLFTVSSKLLNDNKAVHLHDLAKEGSTGSIVIFAYGRYNYSLTGDILMLGQRDGGHAVTLSRLARSGPGSEIILWSRDPAQDENPTNLHAQSPFAHRTYTVKEYPTISGGSFIGNRAALNHQPGASLIRIIDSMIAIRPLTGLWGSSGPQNFTLNLSQPIKLKGFNYKSRNEVASIPGTLIDFDTDIFGKSVYSIVNQVSGSAHLLSTDTVTGQSTELVELGSGFTKIATSRFGEVCVVEPTKMVCLDPEAAVVEPISIAPPHPASAIAYCDKKDEFIVLSSPAKKIMRFGSKLDRAPIVHDLPFDWPLQGPASIAVHPNGTYFILVEGTNLILTANFDIAGAPPLFGAFNLGNLIPQDISFSDDGRMFLPDGDTLHVFQETAFAGWQPDLDSPFHGTPGGTSFRIGRSRTNYDPGVHENFAINIDPDELQFGGVRLDCDADLNEDGDVDVFDLLVLLENWGACPENAPCAEDLTRDDQVGVFDLLMLLDSWGSCP